ncbi:large ribosomal subunit protein P3-like [Vicia villosa]|uniref:large ribosomal subunit protein P3-like n=1 Tax=Vicia villosa TaxID=3911 RepID=UPI00273ADA9F|nr:large ribosomal subunit protein P3-like [Vicia villosa]
MGVFTFVLNKTGAEWSAKQHSGDIEASAGSTFEIQRELVKAALAVDSGSVQSSYSPISPSSAVFQVIVGGAVFVGGGAAAAAPAGGAAPAADAPAASKKEEKVEEEEEDDDMGFSLFD